MSHVDLHSIHPCGAKTKREGRNCYNLGPIKFEGSYYCHVHDPRPAAMRGMTKHSSSFTQPRTQEVIQSERCGPCRRFFSRYRCGVNVGGGECDCPKCQGYCKCR